MLTTYNIYTLVSSENPEIIRYVGYCGKRIPKARLRDHLYEGRNYKNIKNRKANWVHNIISNNYQVVMDIIESDILTVEEAWQKEIEYIKLYKACGAELVNGNLGGQGNSNHKKYTKKEINNKIEKVTTQKLDYYKTPKPKNHIGKYYSPESRKKLSDQRKEKSNSIKYTNIYQYDCDNVFIKEWSSVKEILENLKGSFTMFSLIFNNKIKNKYKGYIWKLTKDN